MVFITFLGKVYGKRNNYYEYYFTFFYDLRSTTYFYIKKYDFNTDTDFRKGHQFK